MLKLLIAEDEALERKALRFILNRYYSECIQIVDEVSNGRDAVERALLLKPDIILMDIHMPVMDGLEASSIIKSKYKDIEFIILTAFNYFDYAKKAINIGVSDYLLKPFSNDEFFQSLNKVMDKLNSKIFNEIKDKKLKKNYQKAIPYIEKQMVANIVYGVPMTIEQINEYKDFLSIDSDKFCCLTFRLEDKRNFGEDNLQMIKNRISTVFPKNVMGLCLSDIVAFVFDEEVDSKILSKGFENFLGRLREEFTTNSSVGAYVGVGSICKEFDNLYLSYKEARRASYSSKNKGTVCNSGITRSEYNDIVRTNNVLYVRIINEDLNGAIIEVDNILSNILNRDENNDFISAKKVLLDTFETVIENIHEFAGKDYKNFNKERMLQELTNLRGISELKNCSIIIIKNLIDYIYSYKKSKNIDVVEKVKKYIEGNYMSEISLDLLAQYVSMSSFYLSRIFSKVEGLNIKEYIIKIRMEKAKSMLQQGKKSIKQIAIDVGYVDQNYFSKAFKKYTNLSPREYCCR